MMKKFLIKGRKKIVQGTGEEDFTILCTHESQLPSTEVRIEVENQENEGSKFVDFLEEELTEG